MDGMGPVLLLIAVSGLSGLALTAWNRPPARGLRLALVVLGLSVTVYPALLWLGVRAHDRGVLGALGLSGHVLPLTMVQLVPVLAVGVVTRRHRRRWTAAILGVAGVGAVATGLGLAGVPGAPALLVLATTLWFGSFLLSPLGTWSVLRGATGETRRRAVVAGLASLVPVVIILWCLCLGLAADRFGITEEASVGTLLVGFSAATLLCAILSLAAVGHSGSPLLRTRAVVGLLDALLAAVTMIVAWSIGMLAADSHLPQAWPVLVGVVVTLGFGLLWTRWHAWAARVVDPAAELRHELDRIGRVVDGRHRQAVLNVLGRVVADPDLRVRFAVEPDVWVGADDAPAGPPAEGERGVVLAGPPETPEVVAVAGSETTADRLRRLGDCTDLMRPAVLEARVAWQADRADRAAAAERRRISQDLHDGIQGRLLGLALNLQLSGRALDDPAARLLVEEAVGSLRGMVDDVRALVGGRLPEILAGEGLKPALEALFRPMAPRVRLDLPPGRLPPAVEATAYFVVGEAVSNALKHARAEQIEVRVGAPTDGRLTATVTDDGVGGADPRLGSGLRGMAERVTADGGVLVVHDGSPRGTVVELVLPCGS